jgi:hypothetical protein
MRLAILAALPLALALPGAALAAENRCGLLDNPSPANWWLTISTQGGHQAEGMENMPESLFEKGWVAVNGSYGYRCACLKMDTDPATQRVRKIHSAKALPMSRCDGDKALQKYIRDNH